VAEIKQANKSHEPAKFTAVEAPKVKENVPQKVEVKPIDDDFEQVDDPKKK
jgi:hypothetical protein